MPGKQLYNPHSYCCSRTFLVYLFLRFPFISYGRFIAIRYNFKRSTYVQEPLVIGRRGSTGRGSNEETLDSRQWTLAVQWESSHLRERCKGGNASECVILIKNDLVVSLDTAYLFYIKKKWINKTSEKKITKTVCDSTKHTRLPKGVLLLDWALRDIQGKKGDRVGCVITE